MIGAMQAAGPDDYRQQFASALASLKAGDLAEATAICVRLSQAEPDDPAVLQLRERQKDFEVVKAQRFAHAREFVTPGASTVKLDHLAGGRDGRYDVGDARA